MSKHKVSKPGVTFSRVAFVFAETAMSWTAVDMPTTEAEDIVGQFKKGTLPAVVSGSIADDQGLTVKKYIRTANVVALEIRSLGQR